MQNHKISKVAFSIVEFVIAVLVVSAIFAAIVASKIDDKAVSKAIEPIVKESSSFENGPQLKRD